MNESQITQKIKDIINSQYHLTENNGYYEGEIYADYRDELSIDTIKKIFNSDNPKDCFYELLDECYFDCQYDYQNDILKEVEKQFCLEEDICYSEYEEFIREWIFEHVCFYYPVSHYLNQSICVDIIVDTGDRNHDFSCNELFGCNYTKKGWKENSSLIWLAQQQGYTIDQIKRFIEDEDFQDSKFLYSVYDECCNTSTCMNALTFFIEMTIGELLDILEKITTEKNTSLIIGEKTSCGLYDPWNGAGSILEIYLEKDVKLPVKYIDTMKPDGCRGYSVASIYGATESLWERGSVKLCSNKSE